MKNLLFSFNLLSLLALAAGGCFAQVTESSEPVPDEEYEVYSAYIDQIYVNLQNDWFTIAGKELKTFRHLDKIRQVVISPITRTTLYSGFSGAPHLKEIPAELTAPFFEINKPVYRLTDKFKTKIEHRIFSQTLDEARAYAAEIERRKITYDAMFLEKFPKATGSVAFFRVVFDKARRNALLGVGQSNIRDGNTFGNRRGGDLMVLFSKIDEKWIVKKIYPDDVSVAVDPAKCQPRSTGYGFGLGSSSFQVSGLKNGKCAVSEFYEIEGGYAKTNCLLPASLGEIIAAPGGGGFSGIPEIFFVYSKNISGYCEKLKTGNLLLENIMPKR